MALLRKIYQTLLFVYTNWAVLAIEKLLDNLLSNLIKNVCIGFSILQSTSMSFKFTKEKLLHALRAYVFLYINAYEHSFSQKQKVKKQKVLSTATSMKSRV